jgi:hypothetical protein
MLKTRLNFKCKINEKITELKLTLSVLLWKFDETDSQNSYFNFRFLDSNKQRESWGNLEGNIEYYSDFVSLFKDCDFRVFSQKIREQYLEKLSKNNISSSSFATFKLQIASKASNFMFS